MRSSQKIAITLLLFNYAFALLQACTKKDQKQGRSPAAETIMVDSTPRPLSEILFLFEQIDNSIHITLAKAPTDLSELTCFIGGQTYPKCQNGLVLQDLPLGEHILTAHYTHDKKAYSEQFRFIMEASGLSEDLRTDGIDSPFIISAEDERSKLNEAAAKESGHLIPLRVSKPEACEPVFFCSGQEERWYQCTSANTDSYHIYLPSHAVYTGFQAIKVKAICSDSELESNVTEFSFYGVTSQYDILSLRSSSQGRHKLFHLERPVDCFGQVRYECSTAEAPDLFQTCSNLVPNQAPTTHIRAKCVSPSQEVSVGPIFDL